MFTKDTDFTFCDAGTRMGFRMRRSYHFLRHSLTLLGFPLRFSLLAILVAMCNGISPVSKHGKPLNMLNKPRYPDREKS